MLLQFPDLSLPENGSVVSATLTFWAQGNSEPASVELRRMLH